MFFFPLSHNFTVLDLADRRYFFFYICEYTSKVYAQNHIQVCKRKKGLFQSPGAMILDIFVRYFHLLWLNDITKYTTFVNPVRSGILFI